MIIFPGPFRQILAELELLSHGKTQTWNKSALSADLDRTPQGETHPPHIEYRRRWLHSYSDTEREQIQREAKALLSEWKGHKRPVPKIAPEPQHIIDARIVETGEGWEAADVARFYGMTIKAVLALRLRVGRDPSTGKTIAPPEDLAVEARRMKASGMTVRQIAAYQNQSKSVVGRMLKKAA